ncbi:MAG: hypothetical protein CML16_14895 [Pusillimonas sp.]|nr:hypothetical protein [Pusillimonas sp.]
MFSIENQTANFNSWNPRTELHGEERVPAADIKVDMAVSNDILSMFDPTLKSLLYREPHAGESDLVDQADDAPQLSRLRFPKIKNSIQWNYELVGATVIIHNGLSGPKSDIELDDCTVDKFVFDPQDGGTVHVSMRIQCKPSEKQAGRLYELNGNTIELTIRPPEAEASLAA